MKQFLSIIKEKIAKFFATFIIVGIIIGVPVLIGFLGIGIMRFLGIYYKSMWDLILFFICFFALEFPLGFIMSNLPKVLYEKFHLISKYTTKVLQQILSFVLSFLILSFLDLLSRNIQISWYSMVGFSIFYTILNYFLGKECN